MLITISACMQPADTKVLKRWKASVTVRLKKFFNCSASNLQTKQAEDFVSQIYQTQDLALALKSKVPNFCENLL